MAGNGCAADCTDQEGTYHPRFAEGVNIECFGIVGLRAPYDACVEAEEEAAERSECRDPRDEAVFWLAELFYEAKRGDQTSW